MKKVALAAVLAVVASNAFAGNMAEPVMEPVVVVEEAASSSGAGLIVPLLLIAIVVAVASN